MPPSSPPLEHADAILGDAALDPTERILQLQQEGDWPDALFHTFACDCAERALQREAQRQSSLPPAPTKALEAKRRWLRSEIDQSTLDQAVAAARLAAHEASISQQGYEAFTAAADAASEIRYAPRAVAWALAAATHHLPPSEQDAARDAEAQWQLQHLRHLLQQFS